MIHEAAASEEMVTVFVAADPAEQALAESTLRGSGIPFATHNAGVQHLVGAGQVGGFNVATGPPEIQVTATDAERATRLLREALDQTGAGFQVETETAEEAAAKVLAVRYARYSAVWAVLMLWGVGSLLGIYFGIQSLRRSRGALTLTKALALFGLTLGLIGAVYFAVSLAPGIGTRIP